ncbi:MAG: YggS family pyridoxal phosphate-dependent enzyme [Halomonadaceae bacterium]|nr:MAG: YggS family pyridoxal phosphate-dependent enzyme [Halomonadaceae bacterium]
MSSIADKLQLVRQRIENASQSAARSAESVMLLAVSKTKPAALLREAAAAGVTRFGENYLQEALDKIAALEDLPQLEWHFIGPIQSNKTRDISAHFDWVHSVDRAKVARRLSEQRPEHLSPLNICIQVNLDGEESKSGIAPEAVAELADTIVALPGLRLRGLMAIPDPDNSPEQQHLAFRRLAQLLAQLQQQHPLQPQLDTLSMGMSGDLEIAIAEGATLVRVGSALFGPRGK